MKVSVIFFFAFICFATATVFGIGFKRNDFSSVREVKAGGQSAVYLTLSEGGRKKAAVFSKENLGQEVTISIGTVARKLRLREPLKGDGIQLTFSDELEVQKVMREFKAK